MLKTWQAALKLDQLLVAAVMAAPRVSNSSRSANRSLHWAGGIDVSSEGPGISPNCAPATSNGEPATTAMTAKTLQSIERASRALRSPCAAHLERHWIDDERPRFFEGPLCVGLRWRLRIVEVQSRIVVSQL